MIKSIASLLGLLIGISIIYYISFWGAFDINIFQYLAATDIVKGIAYPLRFGALEGVAFIATLVIICFYVFTIRIQGIKHIDKNKVKEKKATIISSIFFLLLSFIILFVFFNDSIVAGLIFSLFFMILIFNISYYFTSLTKEVWNGDMAVVREKGRELLSDMIGLLELPMIALFSINALISGYIEANAIKSGKSFDYVLVKDIPSALVKTNEKYLLFLGSAGEKYFFIDRFSSEHFIIDKGVIQVLKSFHFERKDKKAEEAFARNTQ